MDTWCDWCNVRKKPRDTVGTPAPRPRGRWHIALALGLGACGGGERTNDTPARSEGTATAARPAGGGAEAGGAGAGSPGAELYQRCVTCHQANGAGVAGVYPPLAGSEWVLGQAGVPIRILLHGIQGPITVRDSTYNGLMPAYGVGVPMSDDEVAAVLTYVRSSWGNQAAAVTAAEVAQVRAATAGRTGPWTAEELTPLR